MEVVEQWELEEMPLLQQQARQVIPLLRLEEHSQREAQRFAEQVVVVQITLSSVDSQEARPMNVVVVEVAAQDHLLAAQVAHQQVVAQEAQEATPRAQ